MDFEQALDYMQGLIRFGWKLGNDRMEALCARLGSPHRAYPVLHITGTKGKGSTTALAAGVLQAAGYRVGSYFSPYVYDVCERVQAQGTPIPRSEFARLVAEIQPHIEALKETEHGQTTEFELKTALAFRYFAEQNVDFACIEVGIGGRLDATNIVSPAVAVITNIGLDHTEILGDTHAKIAFEKAGIIKPTIPCFTATENPEAFEVIAQVAAERHAPLIRVQAETPSPLAPLPRCGREESDAPSVTGEEGLLPSAAMQAERTSSLSLATSSGGDNADFSPSPAAWERGSGGEGVSVAFSDDPQFGTCTIRTARRTYPDLELRMGGRYQRINAACAVAAVEEALAQRGAELPVEAVRQGLATTALPGRLTVATLPNGATVVLDGAHNALAAHALREPLETLRRRRDIRRTLLVIGMVGGHEPEGIFAALAPGVAKVFACQPAWKRAQPAERIAEVARTFVSQVETYPTVQAAAQAAFALAEPRDLVLITGSFYTVGEVPLSSLPLQPPC